MANSKKKKAQKPVLEDKALTPDMADEAKTAEVIEKAEVAESKEKAKEPKQAKTEKKAKKQKKTKEPRQNKVKETVAELKKVTWPTFPKVVKNTLLVLGIVLVFTVVLFGIDFGLSWLYRLLTSTL